jgi:hypothetical protein
MKKTNQADGLDIDQEVHYFRQCLCRQAGRHIRDFDRYEGLQRKLADQLTSS